MPSSFLKLAMSFQERRRLDAGIEPALVLILENDFKVI
jgi:hypothetical protein